jgi:multidrug efflux pump
VPLLVGHGAGSEVRLATGITVFAGMLGVTIFGLFLTPVFYVALRKWVCGQGKDRTLQNMPDAPQLVDEISEVH